ncbi:MAG: bifunctional DNA-formamidopyrimidine glycosylase/DNA-(apurinic or apyrimidinic site) lyase [Patescibacteria group bacterium]
MPELPEVETITQDLKRRLTGWVIVDVWSDWPRYFVSSGGLTKVRRFIKDKKINKIERRGKNILFYLSDGYVLAVHLKMTGHFLFNEPERKSFVHLIFNLRSDLPGRSDLGVRRLYFSDVRKFGRVIFGEKDKVLNRPEIKKLGPDPLEITTKDFLQLISKHKGKIKTVLLNQEFLAGVGNIYSDEALYLAKIYPLSRTEKIPKDKLKLLFSKLVWILKKSIKLRGTTRQDYRDTSGQKGGYFNQRLVYARRGEKCLCGGRISTVKIGSRTAHFCHKCQKLYQ